MAWVESFANFSDWRTGYTDLGVEPDTILGPVCSLGGTLASLVDVGESLRIRDLREEAYRKPGGLVSYFTNPTRAAYVHGKLYWACAKRTSQGSFTKRWTIYKIDPVAYTATNLYQSGAVNDATWWGDICISPNKDYLFSSWKDSTNSEITVRRVDLSDDTTSEVVSASVAGIGRNGVGADGTYIYVGYTATSSKLLRYAHDGTGESERAAVQTHFVGPYGFWRGAAGYRIYKDNDTANYWDVIGSGYFIVSVVFLNHASPFEVVITSVNGNAPRDGYVKHQVLNADHTVTERWSVACGQSDSTGWWGFTPMEGTTSPYDVGIYAPNATDKTHSDVYHWSAPYKEVL